MSKQTKLINQPIATIANLNYGGGSVELDVNGYFYALEINYKGIIKANLNLPNTFLYAGGKNKIIIVRLGQDEFPNNFMDYVGNLKINSTNVYNGSSNIVSTSINTQENYFYNKSLTFNKLTSNFDLLGNYEYQSNDSILPKKSVFTQSLKTSKQNFIDRDNNVYVGDYHVDGNGVFRSGKTRTKNSVVLTKKTNKSFKIKSVIKKLGDIKELKNG